MIAEEITKLADHSSQQGVVWFLSAALICVVTALIFLVKWIFSEWLKDRQRADMIQNQQIDYLKVANRDLVAVVTKNNDLFSNVHIVLTKNNDLFNNVMAVVIRLDDHLKRIEKNDR